MTDQTAPQTAIVVHPTEGGDPVRYPGCDEATVNAGVLNVFANDADGVNIPDVMWAPGTWQRAEVTVEPAQAAARGARIEDVQ